VKIHFFTINNTLSSPSFYIAAKSELDMLNFVALFFLQTFSAGAKPVTE